MGCTKCKEKKRSGSPMQSAPMSSHNIFLEREIILHLIIFSYLDFLGFYSLL